MYIMQSLLWKAWKNDGIAIMNINKQLRYCKLIIKIKDIANLESADSGHEHHA